MANGKRASKLKAGVVREVKSAPGPVVQAHAAGFVVGDQVKHKIFGIGVVVSKRHDALTIRFGKTGIREIRADFVVAG